VQPGPLTGRIGSLPERYSKQDLAILTREERAHLRIGDAADPSRNPELAWELLYRLEPELYDRLASAESLHPGILDWLPDRVERIVEVAAGSGRLTLALTGRCRELTAIEPAGPMRTILARKLERFVDPGGRVADRSPRVRIVGGFFDALPVSDRSAELVITCSALTPEPLHGGRAGLAEMERVCASGGMVAVVWPNHPEWLTAQGYRYLAFEGEMAMAFASLAEAIELARIFYPDAAAEIMRRGDRRVPYEVVGVNPPRDLAYKTIA
jgi:SAM-dependent methyltransferase